MKTITCACRVGRRWGLTVSIVVFLSAASGQAQTTFGHPPSGRLRVNVSQSSEVKQGGVGTFAVDIEPRNSGQPITLRIQKGVGTGAAVFDDEATEKIVERSQEVSVKGLVASNIPGDMTLTVWKPGEGSPIAIAYFDVLAASPRPRIYFDGRDITDKSEHAVVGQQVVLTVILHPSLRIRSEDWTIGEGLGYVGGFLHTPFLGGPQPVVRKGSTTTFYWLEPGDGRKVTYRLRLESGEELTAAAWFDVSGPARIQIQTELAKVMVGRSVSGDTNYMGFAGPGIEFHGSYELKPEHLKNFTWVQLITEDTIVTVTSGQTMVCVPKTLPLADAGTGLDTNYPYDTRNPTWDSPPVELTGEAQHISRMLRAKIYLLWSSGKTNSIPVPLGSVAWHFSGHAVKVGEKQWQLASGHAGLEGNGFQDERAYPQWNNLVPYSGVLTCR